MALSFSGGKYNLHGERVALGTGQLTVANEELHEICHFAESSTKK